MWTTIFICLLVAPLSSALSPLSFITSAAGIVLDLAKFAFTIYQHIDEKNSASNEKEEIIQTISNKIESTSESLYTKLLLNLQFNKIEETQVEINSRMIDLKNCLTAQESEVEGYKDIFMKWAYPAVSKARYLSNHLLEPIAGSNKNIIQMVAETSRCNQTAMDILTNNSLQLMSDGMLIEMTWLRMEKNFSLDTETAFWENELNNVLAGFQQEFIFCSSKERDLALEDLRNSGDLTKLHDNNAERYQWAWNDVFLIDNGIPGLFGYYQVDESKVLIHKSNGKTKMVTYNKTIESFSGFKAENLSQIVKERITMGGNDADEIAAKVKGAMKEHTVRYSSLIVYFNGAKYQPSKVIDQESQAIRADTDKRYVDHCNSFWCPINWNNWLGAEETEHGYFSVYVVFDKGDNTSEPSFMSDKAAGDALSGCLLWACIIGRIAYLGDY